MAGYRCPYCADILHGGEKRLPTHLRVCKRWPEAITAFAHDIAIAHDGEIRSLRSKVAELEAQLKGTHNGDENSS